KKKIKKKSKPSGSRLSTSQRPPRLHRQSARSERLPLPQPDPYQAARLQSPHRPALLRSPHHSARPTQLGRPREVGGPQAEKIAQLNEWPWPQGHSTTHGRGEELPPGNRQGRG
ncbi:Unknown protein, partial [Striga hermonthica]